MRIYCRRSVFQWCFCLLYMSVNNQQYHGEIGVFHNKLRVIKCITIFLTHRCVTPIGLLTLKDCLWLWTYVVIILQCIRRVNVNSLTFSYIFQVLFFQSHFYFYTRFTGLSGDFKKNPGPNSKLDQSFSIFHWKIQSLIAYNCIHHFDIICLSVISVILIVFAFILNPLYQYRY